MVEERKNGADRLLTVHELAIYLAVTERTVYRLLKEHKLPALRIGGQWRFKAEMIEEWMQKESVLA